MEARRIYFGAELVSRRPAREIERQCKSVAFFDKRGALIERVKLDECPAVNVVPDVVTKPSRRSTELRLERRRRDRKRPVRKGVRRVAKKGKKGKKGGGGC